MRPVGRSPSRSSAANLTTDPAAEHFELYREAFREAAAACGGVESRLIKLGDARVRLDFAGAEIRDAYATSHNAPLAATGTGAEPDGVIEIFESAVSGVAAPCLGWRKTDPTPEQGARYEGSEILALQDLGSPALTLARPASAVAVHHVPSSGAVTDIQRGTAFRFALMHVLTARDLHFLHAAAVGEDGAGVMLAGASGTGKSTLSTACFNAGLQWAGDDYVVLEPGAGGRPPRVHMLHAIAKLTPYTLSMLEPAGWTVSPPVPPEGKHVVIPDPSDPRLALTLKLRGILVPRLGADFPAVTPASALDSFAALAPTTMFQITSRRMSSLAGIRRLTQSLPNAFIDLGPDHARNAEAVRQAIHAF